MIEVKGESVIEKFVVLHTMAASKLGEVAGRPVLLQSRKKRFLKKQDFSVAPRSDADPRGVLLC